MPERAFTAAGEPSALQSVLELEALAACWLAMEHATTLVEIERAVLDGLLALTGRSIAYTSRREDGVWTISLQVGLIGDVEGVALREASVPYAEPLREGQTICYESARDMNPQLALTLDAIGMRSLFAVPIMRNDTCVGSLAIGEPEASRFSPHERALVRLFTSHLSALLGKRDLVQSLETLAESVPAIVLRTEPSGWINWYNQRWYSFTGQTREEAAGWGWQTAHHSQDFLRVMEEWPKALATGQPIEIEFRLRRYDGVYHWHLARVEPVRDDKGAILSWYGTVVDIEAQKQALERTQRVAETLQEAFLPQRLPQRDTMRLDAIYVSAEEDARVGGDWYDAFELPDGRLGLSIGDITGHGLAASLAVGKLRQTIFTLARRLDDPAAILAEVNRILCAQEPDTFASALVGFVDREERTLRYATAGHPPPIIAHSPSAPAMVLPTDGPPLGVTGELLLSTFTVPLHRDSVVALYTDGVTESARNGVAGEQALQALLPRLVGNASIARPARVIYEALLNGVAPQDDAAVLLLQFSAPVASIEDDELVSSKQWRFHASDAGAAHVARREIGAYLIHICGEAEETYRSELIIGELLANTVAHAPGLVHLTIEWIDDRFVLIVRDSGPGLGPVRPALPEDPMDEGSRGLFLVYALATEVTVAQSPAGGAELRVVLPLRPRPQRSERSS